jgi:hypothetical protein
MKNNKNPPLVPLGKSGPKWEKVESF